MKLYRSDFAAVVAVLVALLGNRLDLSIHPAPVVPAPSVPTPAPALQAIVTPIAAIVTGEKAAADRQELASYFAALAEFHGRDRGTLLTTTAQLRRHNEVSSLAMFEATGIKGRYAGLAVAIEKGLGAHLGLLNADGSYKAQAFDAALAAKAAEFYTALSWAFSQPLAKG